MVFLIIDGVDITLLFFKRFGSFYRSNSEEINDYIYNYDWHTANQPMSCSRMQARSGHKNED